MRVKSPDRNVSLRTCCSCRLKKPKHQLIRYVWQDGKVLADTQQNQPGRGAYCCDNEQCVELLLDRKKKWKRLFRL